MPEHRIRLPNIRYFRNEHGVLEELHGYFRPVIAEEYVVGVLHNDKLCEIYDHERRIVVVHLHELIILPIGDVHIQQIPYGHVLNDHRFFPAPYLYFFP